MMWARIDFGQQLHQASVGDNRYFLDTNTIDTLHLKISMYRYFDNLFHQTPKPYVNFVRRVQKFFSP